MFFPANLGGKPEGKKAGRNKQHFNIWFGAGIIPGTLKLEHISKIHQHYLSIVLIASQGNIQAQMCSHTLSTFLLQTIEF